MTKIFMIRIKDKFHVLLRHPNGEEELSHQSYATKEECGAAIQQYAKDRGVELERVQ